MSELPVQRLHRLLAEFLVGELNTELFCSMFERTYNLELDKSSLSPAEVVAFAALFEKVVLYSPFPEERERIPNYRSENDIAKAAQIAADRIAAGSGG